MIVYTVVKQWDWSFHIDTSVFPLIIFFSVIFGYFGMIFFGLPLVYLLRKVGCC
jgi:hypothetical protein